MVVVCTDGRLDERLDVDIADDINVGSATVAVFITVGLDEVLNVDIADDITDNFATLAVVSTDGRLDEVLNVDIEDDISDDFATAAVVVLELMAIALPVPALLVAVVPSLMVAKVAAVIDAGPFNPPSV